MSIGDYAFHSLYNKFEIFFCTDKYLKSYIRDMCRKVCRSSSIKRPLFLSSFSPNSKVSTYFSRTNVKFHDNPTNVFSNLTHGQTDRHYNANGHVFCILLTKNTNALPEIEPWKSSPQSVTAHGLAVASAAVYRRV